MYSSSVHTKLLGKFEVVAFINRMLEYELHEGHSSFKKLLKYICYLFSEKIMRVACAVVHTPKIENSIKLHACSKITPFRVHFGPIHCTHLLFLNQMKTFEPDQNRKLEKTLTLF